MDDYSRSRWIIRTKINYTDVTDNFISPYELYSAVEIMNHVTRYFGVTFSWTDLNHAYFTMYNSSTRPNNEYTVERIQ